MVDSGASQIYEAIRREKIIAIVRGVPACTIVPIAEALYAGGVRLMEITCNTPNVTEMIAEVSAATAGRMLIGAGTVISADLAEQASLAGARYMVAPDVNPEVIRYCTERDIAVIPGAVTATEALNAYRLGARMVKIFPAEALGTAYIKQLRGPLDNIEFVAVGGVTVANAGDFFRAGCVAVGVGGSLVSSDLVANADWPAITRLAQETRNAFAPSVKDNNSESHCTPRCACKGE